MKDGLINEGENEMNLLKKNLSSEQVTDPRTTRMVRFEPCHMYDMVARSANPLKQSKAII